MSKLGKIYSQLKKDDYIVMENEQYKPFNKFKMFINIIKDESIAENKQVFQNIMNQKLLNKKILNYQKSLNTPQDTKSSQILQKNFPLFKKQYKQQLINSEKMQNILQEEYTIIDKQSYLSSKTLDLNKKILIVVTNQQKSEHQRLRIYGDEKVQRSFDGLDALEPLERLEGGQVQENKHHIHSTKFRRKSVEDLKAYQSKQIRINNLYDHVIQQSIINKKNFDQLCREISKQRQLRANMINKGNSKYVHIRGKIQDKKSIDEFNKRRGCKFQTQVILDQVQDIKIPTQNLNLDEQIIQVISETINLQKQQMKQEQIQIQESIVKKKKFKKREKLVYNSIQLDSIKNIYNVQKYKSSSRLFAKKLSLTNLQMSNGEQQSLTQSKSQFQSTIQTLRNTSARCKNNFKYNIPIQDINKTNQNTCYSARNQIKRPASTIQNIKTHLSDFNEDLTKTQFNFIKTPTNIQLNYIKTPKIIQFNQIKSPSQSLSKTAQNTLNSKSNQKFINSSKLNLYLNKNIKIKKDSYKKSINKF